MLASHLAFSMVVWVPSSSAGDDVERPRSVVILDDGCPDSSAGLNFGVRCEAVSNAIGEGQHSAMLLEALINYGHAFGLPFKEVIFVNTSDVRGGASQSAILEGIALARGMKPSVISLSYSFSRYDFQIERSLYGVVLEGVKVYAAYSNLSAVEESYPASLRYVVGVTVGASTRWEDDSTFIVERGFVRKFSPERASNSIATILAVAHNFGCGCELW